MLGHATPDRARPGSRQHTSTFFIVSFGVYLLLVPQSITTFFFLFRLCIFSTDSLHCILIVIRLRSRCVPTPLARSKHTFTCGSQSRSHFDSPNEFHFDPTTMAMSTMHTHSHTAHQQYAQINIVKDTKRTSKQFLNNTSLPAHTNTFEAQKKNGNKRIRQKQNGNAIEGNIPKKKKYFIILLFAHLRRRAR